VACDKPATDAFDVPSQPVVFLETKGTLACNILYRLASHSNSKPFP
jgi:hypothetical protein